MLAAVPPIPLPQLVVALLPAVVVVVFLFRWTNDGRRAAYAVLRMLVQLVLVGYVLSTIFELHRATLVLVVLAGMLAAASWIALGPVEGVRKANYLRALAAIAAGGVSTLLLVTQAVLDLDPWFAPRYVIPLAGMTFANAMNSVSLAAERFEAERVKQASYAEARQIAFRASLIPVINSLFAVGLVSFPGMMTGQILSGVSPLIAARYQIMVMSMVFGASGIASACYLRLAAENDERLELATKN